MRSHHPEAEPNLQHPHLTHSCRAHHISLQLGHQELRALCLEASGRQKHQSILWPSKATPTCPSRLGGMIKSEVCFD